MNGLSVIGSYPLMLGCGSRLMRSASAFGITVAAAGGGGGGAAASSCALSTPPRTPVTMPARGGGGGLGGGSGRGDRKSTRLNSSHSQISYAVFCLKKK